MVKASEKESCDESPHSKGPLLRGQSSSDKRPLLSHVSIGLSGGVIDRRAAKIPCSRLIRMLYDTGTTCPDGAFERERSW